jgi:DNA-binding NtrC family response regulator
MRQAIESLFTRARSLFERRGSEQRVERVKVLGLLGDERDRGLLATAAARNQWDLTFARDYQEARRLLEEMRPPVVLCDRDLLDQDWWFGMEGLAACSGRSSILLVSKVADHYLWNEIVRRGGYDVLSKPLQEEELVRAVKLAWSYWTSTSQTTR